jgi:hypothetical protein
MLNGETFPLVSVKAIDVLWPRIEMLFSRVVDEKVHLEDIYNFCLDGTWLLWVHQVPETGEITAAAITEFIEYPKVTHLKVLFLSGDDGDWLSGMSIFERFACINQCAAVEIHGRKGWERVLKNGGYELSHITLSKRIL